jgi:hypothetical protein
LHFSGGCLEDAVFFGKTEVWQVFLGLSISYMMVNTINDLVVYLVRHGERADHVPESNGDLKVSQNPRMINQFL